jgi:hypothetical protein
MASIFSVFRLRKPLDRYDTYVYFLGGLKKNHNPAGFWPV